METHQNIRLTSAELASLWPTYLADTMSICVFKFYLSHLKDTEIRLVAEQAINLSKQHVEFIEQIFKKEVIPIPVGFTDQDVNLSSPLLFQDTFILQYIKHMAKG